MTEPANRFFGAERFDDALRTGREGPFVLGFAHHFAFLAAIADGHAINICLADIPDSPLPALEARGAEFLEIAGENLVNGTFVGAARKDFLFLIGAELQFHEEAVGRAR